MEQRCISRMAKPQTARSELFWLQLDPKMNTQDSMHRKNGYTIAQTLFVLMIIVITIGVFSLPRSRSGAGVYARTIVEVLNREQYKAIAGRKTRRVDLMARSMQTEEERLDYPGGIACQPHSVSWNAKGSISKGGSIRCTSNGGSFSIIMQLGSGRARIEFDEE